MRAAAQALSTAASQWNTPARSLNALRPILTLPRPLPEPSTLKLSCEEATPRLLPLCVACFQFLRVDHFK